MMTRQHNISCIMCIYIHVHLYVFARIRFSGYGRSAVAGLLKSVITVPNGFATNFNGIAILPYTHQELFLILLIQIKILCIFYTFK